MAVLRLPPLPLQSVQPGLSVAQQYRPQTLGEAFQRGQRGGQSRLLLGRKADHAFGDDPGSLRRDALPGLFPSGVTSTRAAR